MPASTRGETKDGDKERARRQIRRRRVGAYGRWASPEACGGGRPPSCSPCSPSTASCPTLCSSSATTWMHLRHCLSPVSACLDTLLSMATKLLGHLTIQTMIYFMPPMTTKMQSQRPACLLQQYPISSLHARLRRPGSPRTTPPRVFVRCSLASRTHPTVRPLRLPLPGRPSRFPRARSLNPTSNRHTRLGPRQASRETA